MSKTLVIGATGKIGKHLVKALIEKKQTVVAGVRDFAKANDVKEAGAQLVKFEYEDEKSIEASVVGVDSVYIAIGNYPNFDKVVKSIVEASKKAHVKFLVKVSTILLSDKISIDFLDLHGPADQYVIDSGIPYVLLRPGFFMQNLLNYAQAIIHHNSFFGHSGTSKIAYIDARDIADVAATVIADPSKHANQIYDITGPEAITDKDVAALLSKHLKKTVNYVDHEFGAFVALVKSFGMSEMISKMIGDLEANKRNGKSERITDVVAKLTGKSRTMEQFIIDHIAEFSPPPKALLLGGTGKTGKHAIDSLLKTGRFRVAVGVRDEKKNEGLKSKGVELVKFDWNDSKTFSDALKGIEYVYSVNSVYNLDNEKALIDEAKKAGVKLLIRLSVLGSNTDPNEKNPVVHYHGLADAYLKTSGIPYAILQPGFFMDNIVGQIKSIKSHGAFYGVADPKAYAAYIDARDIADVAVHIFKNPSLANKEYPLTGPKAVSNAEIADSFTKIVRPLNYVQITVAQYIQGFVQEGYPKETAEAVVKFEDYKVSKPDGLVIPTVEQFLGKARTYEDYFRENVGLFRKTLVLGASGKTGQHVVHGLLQAGHSVVAAARNTDKLSELKAAGAEVAKFDFAEKKYEALKGVDQLYLVSPDDQYLDAPTNNVVDAAKKAGVKHIVRLSSIGADPESKLPRVQQHGLVDSYLMASGISYTILQPTFFFQNLLGQPVKQRSAISSNVGADSKYSIIDARDISDVAVAALLKPEEHKNKIYTLTAEITTEKETAALLTKHIGKNVNYVSLTDEELAKILHQNKMEDWRVEFYVFLGKIRREGHVSALDPILKTLLGKVRTYEDFIKENVKFFQ